MRVQVSHHQAIPELLAQGEFVIGQLGGQGRVRGQDRVLAQPIGDRSPLAGSPMPVLFPQLGFEQVLGGVGGEIKDTVLLAYLGR